MAKLLLNSYFNDRRQHVSINNIKSANKIIEYGISQGSILGPLLFLIYIYDILSSLLTVLGFFADHTALLISVKSFESVQGLANSELAKVSRWMMANNIIINTRITRQYLKLKILRLDDLYHFEMAKIMYHFIYDKAFLIILIIISNIHLKIHRI